jgi:hypothetical protein
VANLSRIKVVSLPINIRQAFKRFDCFATNLAEFQILQDEFKLHLNETLSSDGYLKIDFLALKVLSAKFEQKNQENFERNYKITTNFDLSASFFEKDF